jgi:hypothetical protein
VRRPGGSSVRRPGGSRVRRLGIGTNLCDKVSKLNNLKSSLFYLPMLVVMTYSFVAISNWICRLKSLENSQF